MFNCRVRSSSLSSSIVSHYGTNRTHNRIMLLDISDLSRKALRAAEGVGSFAVAKNCLIKISELCLEGNGLVVRLLDGISKLEPSLPEVTEVAEAGLTVRYSGYDSVVGFYHRVIRKTLKQVRECPVDDRLRRHPRVVSWTKEIVAWQNLLETMNSTARLSCDFIENSEDLFANIDELSETTRKSLFKHLSTVAAPYGRTLGFQFHESLFYVLNMAAVVMAAFADSRSQHKSRKIMLSTALNSPKYLVDPELKAERVAKVFRTLDVELCKSFWQLTDTNAFVVSTKLMAKPEHYALMDVKTNKKIWVEFDKKLEKFLEPEPNVLQPINIRFISVTNYQESKNEPKSKTIILHVHGGGFVSMSSRSHQIYLIPWANKFKIPIVSVDYGLSPEHIYPHALNDCLRAYFHVNQHPSRFGWTGEKIVLIGDSAGANLCTALSLKLARLNIPQLVKSPDHLFLFYPTLCLKLSISPSRLLSMFDLILNGNVAMHFAMAYTGIVENVPKAEGPETAKAIVEKLQEHNELLSNPLVSPLCSSDQELANLPPIDVFVSKCDPVLDDTIELIQRMNNLNKEANAHLVDGVPHGFLNMLTASNECNKVYNKCTEIIESILGTTGKQAKKS